MACDSNAQACNSLESQLQCTSSTAFTSNTRVHTRTRSDFAERLNVGSCGCGRCPGSYWWWWSPAEVSGYSALHIQTYTLHTQKRSCLRTPLAVGAAAPQSTHNNKCPQIQGYNADTLRQVPAFTHVYWAKTSRMRHPQQADNAKTPKVHEVQQAARATHKSRPWLSDTHTHMQDVADQTCV